MKTLRWLIAGNMAALLLASAALEAAEGWTEYRARPGGSRMAIEGTSTIHDWLSESRIVGGTVQAGPSFVADPAALQPGKLELKANVFIPVRSLKSVKDGKPYSAAMDDIMYEKLRMAEHPNIEFRLASVTVKEDAKTDDGGVMLEAKGDLVVGGETQSITMPVKMKVLDAKRLEFSGSVATKMTDFNIDPPAPALALGAIKTGDEVKLSFEWVVARR
jgi:polyisoprenoid-binding protein YceI